MSALQPLPEMDRNPLRRGRFRLARFASIKLGTAPSYLVKGLLQSTGLAVIWGAPKCGKSFWVFDLLMHVALGWEYRGNRVRQGAIVYCALEGAEGFRRRIEAFRQAKMSEVDDSDPPFYLMTAPLSLVQDRQAFIAEIEMQLGGQRPAAICLDTLNRSLEGSESSDADMSAYVCAADAIGEAFNCLVLIVHHCGHDGRRPRGHSSLMGAADIQIGVKGDAADNIVAEVELSKDGPIGLQIISRLEVIDIGVDQDGDLITSCVVEEVEGGARRAIKDNGARRLPKGAQTALRALSLAVDALGEIPTASNHIPPGVRTVTMEQWRSYAYHAGISDTADPDARRMAFRRAHERLIAGKHVVAWSDHRWPAT
jgi:AAA domain